MGGGDNGCGSELLRITSNKQVTFYSIRPSLDWIVIHLCIILLWCKN